MQHSFCCICLGILCPAAGQLLDVTSASNIHTLDLVALTFNLT